MSPSFEFTAPVLSVAADAVRDLQGGEALSSLWTLFTKCKDSLQDGRRLENILWRVWYHEMATAAIQGTLDEKYTLGDVLNEKTVPSFTDISLTAQPHISSQPMDQTSISYLMPSPHVHPALPPLPHTQRRNSCIGQIIVDMLLNPLPPTLPNSAPSLPHVPRPALSYTKAGVGTTPHPTPPVTPILGSASRFSDSSLPLPPLAPAFASSGGGGSEPLPSSRSSSGESGTSSTLTVVSSSSSIVSKGTSSQNSLGVVQRTLLPPIPPPTTISLFGDVGSTSSKRTPSSRKGVGHAPSLGGEGVQYMRRISRTRLQRQQQQQQHVQLRLQPARAPQPPAPPLVHPHPPAVGSTKSHGLLHPHAHPAAHHPHAQHQHLHLHPHPDPHQPHPHSTHLTRTQQQRQAQAAHAAHVVEQAMLEAQRQFEMFAKKQVPSAKQFCATRTRSVGLLSQLMNPDPQIFPPNHPYRRGISLRDYKATAGGDSGTGAGVAAGQGAGAGQGGALYARVSSPAVQKVAAPAMTRGSSARLHNQRQAAPPPGMKISNSAAASPVALQVQVGSFVPGSSAANGTITAGVMNGIPGSGTSKRYRPKGRPSGQEMEDDSESESDGETGDGLLMPKSVAQAKLKAFAQRRRIAAREMSVDRSREEIPTPISTITHTRILSLQTQPPQQSETQYLLQQQQPQPQRDAKPVLLGHPYNLPPPSAPSTPRTTRRLMLQTEMSESMRRNLLWERQVNKIQLMGPKRSASTVGTGCGGVGGEGLLRPLTTRPNMVQLTAKKAGKGAGQDMAAGVSVGGAAAAVVGEREQRGSDGVGTGAQGQEEKEERRWNRRWAADDFHYAGW